MHQQRPSRSQVGIDLYVWLFGCPPESMSGDKMRSRVSHEVPTSQREQRDAIDPLPEDSVEVLSHIPRTLTTVEESKRNASAGKCGQVVRKLFLGQLSPPGMVRCHLCPGKPSLLSTQRKNRPWIFRPEQAVDHEGLKECASSHPAVTEVGLTMDLAMTKAVQLCKSPMKSKNEELQHQNDCPAGEQSSGTTHGCHRGQSYCYECTYVSQSITCDAASESCEILENREEGEWKGDVNDDADGEELLSLGEIYVLNRRCSLMSEAYLPLSTPVMSSRVVSPPKVSSPVVNSREVSTPVVTPPVVSSPKVSSPMVSSPMGSFLEVSSSPPENVVVNYEGELQHTDFPADTDEPEQVHDQNVIDLKLPGEPSSSVSPDDIPLPKCGAEPVASETATFEAKDLFGAFALLHIRSAANWGKVSVQEGKVPNDCNNSELELEDVFNLGYLAQAAEKTSSPLPTSEKKVALDVVPKRLKIVTRSTSEKKVALDVVHKKLKIVTRSSTERATANLDQARDPEKAASSKSRITSYTGRKKRAYASLKEIDHNIADRPQRKLHYRSLRNL